MVITQVTIKYTLLHSILQLRSAVEVLETYALQDFVGDPLELLVLMDTVDVTTLNTATVNAYVSY